MTRKPDLKRGGGFGRSHIFGGKKKQPPGDQPPKTDPKKKDPLDPLKGLFGQ